MKNQKIIIAVSLLFILIGCKDVDFNQDQQTSDSGVKKATLGEMLK